MSSKSEESQKFDRYCSQLEKYGKTESVHSPALAQLRRKARKHLIEMMKEDFDYSESVAKLWMLGYYCPYQYFLIDKENIMETTTLLTMFCGEIQELLASSSEKYYALWNLYLGDLHRYMSEDEIQKTLSSGFYTKTITLDPRQGRAFQALSNVRTDMNIAQKIRLMLLAQLAEIPHKKNAELIAFLNRQEGNEQLEAKSRILIDFAIWNLNDNNNRRDYQSTGLDLVRKLKTIIDDDDLATTMSACHLVAKLSMKKAGFRQFSNSFEVLSTFYLTFNETNMTTGMLCEVISWICIASEVFESVDPVTKDPYANSMTVFAKTKWNELNDLVMDHMIRVVTLNDLQLEKLSISESTFYLINGPKSKPAKEMLGHFVSQLLSLKNPTIELDLEEEPIFRRINKTEPKRLDIPIEALAEDLSNLNREDWRPVYVIMDFETTLDKFRAAKKVWDIDDFICILPSNVLASLDNQKNKIRAIRPVIRALMELQADGKMNLRQCKDERDCALQLVKSAKGSSDAHKNIVAVLCTKPEEQKPMEGVTFYRIDDFYTKYLK